MSDSALAVAFPQNRDSIREFRTKSAVFDEICSDFELLMAELTVVQQGNLPDAGTLKAQIEDSLSGLRDEIQTYLCSDAMTPQSPTARSDLNPMPTGGLYQGPN